MQHFQVNSWEDLNPGMDSLVIAMTGCFEGLDFWEPYHTALFGSKTSRDRRHSTSFAHLGLGRSESEKGRMRQH